MFGRVAIVGVGYVPLRSITPEVSFRELIFEAAVKAYNDAGVEPRDIGTFVSITEDYNEGTAIADEYVPDQLGAVLTRFMCRASETPKELAFEAAKAALESSA